MKKLIILALLVFLAWPMWAATWMIGDNDGYGAGIADNAKHEFDGIWAGWDGRSGDEKTATNGAQFTDTYSTTHPTLITVRAVKGAYSPQPGSVATFTIPDVGQGWTEGSLLFDMVGFQAAVFGSVIVTFNGIVQPWAFTDGFPVTRVRSFDLGQDVLGAINELSSLTVVVDRNTSKDFYGFDFLRLTLLSTGPTPVPEPAGLLLLGCGLLGLAAARRRSLR